MIVLTFVGCEDDPDDEDYVAPHSVTGEKFEFGVDIEIMVGGQDIGYYHEGYGLWYSHDTGKYYGSITMGLK